MIVTTNLIVTSPAKERLTALAGEGSEVEAGSGFITDPTELVNERVEVFNLEKDRGEVISRGAGNGNVSNNGIKGGNSSEGRDCHDQVRFRPDVNHISVNSS